MSRRRKQQLAAGAAGALVLAIVLATVLSGGGSSDNSRSISVPAAQVPAGSTDPHAQDRKQITALALDYQKALAQATGADPCSYLDPQSRAFASAKARYASPGGAEPCAYAVNQLSGYAGGLYPSGIDATTLQFGLPTQQVRCVDQYSPPVSLPASQRGLSWAIAGWAGAAGGQVTFVKENGRWWVDVLLCHD